MKLTQKQKLFAEYYIQSNNATDAATKAGYSKKTACEIGFENLRKPHIAEYIQAYRDEIAKENKWTMEKLINEFVAVKEKCMQEEPVMKYDKELGEYVETGEYVFKENGVIKALENIGKLLGHYEEKIRHSGEVNTNNPLKDLTAAELKKLIDK